MKKILALALALVMVLGMFVYAAPADKKVLNVMSFTDEVPGMVTKFMEMHPEWAEKFDVETTIVATTDQLYQPALDEKLAAGDVDLYAAEAAFILKYSQGDMSQYAASYEELGIDVAAAVEAAGIAGYTVEIGTRPSDGKVVGLGYQANGGAFIYRRSIAQDVWGSDDPAVVAEKIGAGSGEWDAFYAAAAELKEKGYAIVSGDGDIWHAVENSSDTGWIVDGKLNIDAKREAFFDLSMELKANGYHHDTQDWQEGWFADMKKDGGVLGFYGPAWLINYTIGPNAGTDDNSSAGDWNVCAPNVGFFWGGTWVLAGKGATADPEKTQLVKEIIEFITLDSSETGLQYMWANGMLNDAGTKDVVASSVVMAKSDGSMEFLGGANAFPAFIDGCAYANGKCLTQYDEAINGYFRDAVRQYTAGNMTKDEAIDFFKGQVADNLDVEVD